MKLVDRERREVGIPASSLADIAFLLIIFFMVASLAATVKGIEFNLPDPTLAPRTMQRDQLHLVELGEAGLSLDGRRIGEAELHEALVAHNGDKPVVLRVARTVSYGHFTRVVNGIRATGLRKLSISGFAEGAAR